MKQQKEVQQKKGWSISTILLLLAGIAMIVAALALLVPSLWDRKQSNDAYDTLNEECVNIEANITVDEEKNPNWWYEDVKIDMTSLQEINPDIVGWIRFDNIETISYPVLYSGDNSSYLRTDIYGRSATAGCIFIEAANQPDLSDYHTIIYGHNMRNLSMFGRLKEYKEDGFYEDHQYFTIYTPDVAYRYQIFAYRDVPETHSVYTVGFGPDENYQSFLNEMMQHSYIDTGIDVTKEDKVVTLSTCSTTGNRFVVHAVLVDEHCY